MQEKSRHALKVRTSLTQLTTSIIVPSITSVTSPERNHNPDRPASYEEYLAKQGKALQAEDLFHYFNRDLFVASNKLEVLKTDISRLELPTEDKQPILDLINDIDKYHMHLQTVAHDAIKTLGEIQKQYTGKT